MITRRWMVGGMLAALLLVTAPPAPGGSRPVPLAGFAQDPVQLPPDAAGPSGARVLSPEAEATAARAAERGVTLQRRVLEELDAAGTADVWVVLEDQADLSRAPEIADWAERGRFVHRQLTRTAQAGQARLRAGLDLLGVSYQPYWIVNAMLVHGADRQVLDGVVVAPEVAEIRLDEPVELPDPVAGPDQAGTAAVEWGIANIRAGQVWADLGVRGEGVVVGSIDTGVELRHPALVNQYRGTLGDGKFEHDYNWWDPSGVCPAAAPCDNNNHGTHTTGTMVGDGGEGNQIGVAPRARWIAAKGCESDSCSQGALLSSGQFMLAPTDLAGQNPRPEVRPHVVNNSWGSGAGGRDFFDDVAAAWVAAGVFPVFSNGNGGPGCGTAGSPADGPDVYAVGAHDAGNRIAGFSSRGPGREDEIRPHLSAPGVSVRSAVVGGYGSASGTSMAAPHVAGTVALMWSASGRFGDIAGTREALAATAVDTEDLSCGGTPENNNVYGQGRLDARAATDWVMLHSGIEGRVVDADTSAPVGGVRVEVMETGRSMPTGPDGRYRLALEPGSYTLEFSQQGHPIRAVPAAVAEDAYTTLDVSLGGVRGTVTDPAGEPLAGVQVRAVEAGVTVRTDAGGGYRIRLGPGSRTLAYAQFGYLTRTVPEVVVREAEVTVQDAVLAPAPLGRIAGTVTDQRSGHGVPGVRVTVADVPVDLSATTDLAGRYEIAGVPVATYRVSAESQRPGLWWPSAPVPVAVTEGDVAVADIPLRNAAGAERVSVASDGTESNGHTDPADNGAISADGRYVAFYSWATNLVDVPVPGGGSDSVYLHDRVTGTTELVAAGMFPPLSGRSNPVVSAGGRYVAFHGSAGLVGEVSPPALPPLPRYVVGGVDDRTYLRDRRTGRTELGSVNSRGEAVRIRTQSPPGLTPDGRYLTFSSNDPHLAEDLPVCEKHPADLWVKLCEQVAVRDRESGQTVLASVSSAGEPGNAASHSAVITPDGRYVAFASTATNLVDGAVDPDGGNNVFVHDRQTGRTDWIQVPEQLRPPLVGTITISDDGRFVAFGDDILPRAEPRVVLHDRSTGETVRLAAPLPGGGSPAFAIAAPPMVSGDGSTVAFMYAALDAAFTPIPAATGLFLLDRASGRVDRLVGYEDFAFEPTAHRAISADGRFVTAFAEHDRLVPGGTNGMIDLFVLDSRFEPDRPRPRFALWDLRVEPALVRPGEPVTVTVGVKNVGDAAGAYRATPLVDSLVAGAGTGTGTGTLAPGEATEVTLTVHPEEGGDHRVRVGKLAADLRVAAGHLTGEVVDANDGELIDGATVTATLGATTRTVTTEVGAYRLADLGVGTWTVTVTAPDYVPVTREVVVAADGEEVTAEVALPTGLPSVGPDAIELTVTAGSRVAVPVPLTNAGTADLSWRTFTWGGTAAEQPAVLVYADDGQQGPVEEALGRLGLDYTLIRERPCHPFDPPGGAPGAPGAGMLEFGAELAAGGWDLVIVHHSCSLFQMPQPIVADLAAYVTGGGRLILHNWQANVSVAERTDLRLQPLWAAIGVAPTFLRVSPLPDPGVRWWEADHPLVNVPLPVPEHIWWEPAAWWYPQTVRAVDGARALAGYLLAPHPDYAALVLGNDGRTLYRAYREAMGRVTDRNDNSIADSVELWVDSIALVGGLTVRPWLTGGGSGRLAPDGTAEPVLEVDASALAPGSYTGELGLVSDAGRRPRLAVPVTLRVVGCDRTITGTHRGGLTVTGGVTCLADGARVTGAVRVRPGAGLVATGARLVGSVTATGATVLELRDSRLVGGLTVEGTTGGVSLIENRITGAVRLLDSDTGQTPVVVAGNRILGPLACAGNRPPPVNHGTPNQVTGPVRGQCADL